MAYIIKFKNGRIGQRIYKTKAKAQRAIRSTIKNNSLQQRRQTGFIGMRVIKYLPNQREVAELKRAKDFIFR